MEHTNVQKLARALKLMVLLFMVCNIVVLIFVPAIAAQGSFFQAIEERVLHLLGIQPLPEDDIYIPIIFAALVAWAEVWTDLVWSLYTVFLFLCGCCTLVILRQAYRILGTILKGNPFQKANAHSMRRAAMCCWGIGLMALIRLILELIYHGSTAPLYTYNTLFIPVFFMAGLLFLVMSALFQQATELKEDQDLTI